jgi:type IV secretion system protein VirB10
MLMRTLAAMIGVAATLPAQQASPVETTVAAKTYLVETGTRIPLSMVNSVSTKNTSAGDRVYLETTFPIAVNGKIVIPAGSYVIGTITDAKRPGKVKGRGEMRVRFDSLMLPNGVTRDFRAQLAGLDGRASETLDKSEGTIKSEGNKAGDARVIAETTATGAGIGGLAGIGRAPGMGVGIGAGAGAVAGLIGILVTRGPDAVLAKGTTVEMVLDRQLTYDDSELDFSHSAPGARGGDGGGPLPSVKSQQSGSRRFPI